MLFRKGVISLVCTRQAWCCTGVCIQQWDWELKTGTHAEILWGMAHEGLKCLQHKPHHCKHHFLFRMIKVFMVPVVQWDMVIIFNKESLLICWICPNSSCSTTNISCRIFSWTPLVELPHRALYYISIQHIIPNGVYGKMWILSYHSKIESFSMVHKKARWASATDWGGVWEDALSEPYILEVELHTRMVTCHDHEGMRSRWSW